QRLSVLPKCRPRFVFFKQILHRFPHVGRHRYPRLLNQLPQPLNELRRIERTSLFTVLPNGIRMSAIMAESELSIMHADIVGILGGRRVFGSRFQHLDLLREVERGLPTKAYRIVDDALGLTPDEEDRLLQISVRTRARWKHRPRLDAATSDRLVRLA